MKTTKTMHPTSDSTSPEVIEPEFTPTSLTPLKAESPTTIYKFQAPELTTLAHDITAIALAANKASNGYKKEIAITCARVKLSDEIWKSEGFTGIGDFANKLFGINKAQLSSWIKVANKFYLNDRLKQNPVYSEMPISNLYEIASLTDERLEQMAKSGVITAESTQQELRKLEESESNSGNSAEKAKVVHTYSGVIKVVTGVKTINKPFSGLTKGEIDDLAAVTVDADEVDFTKATSGKTIRRAFIGSNGCFGAYQATRDKRKDRASKSGDKSVTITMAEYEALKAQIQTSAHIEPTEATEG